MWFDRRFSFFNPKPSERARAGEREKQSDRTTRRKEKSFPCFFLWSSCRSIHFLETDFSDRSKTKKPTCNRCANEFRRNCPRKVKTKKKKIRRATERTQRRTKPRPRPAFRTTFNSNRPRKVFFVLCFRAPSYFFRQHQKEKRRRRRKEKRTSFSVFISIDF